MELLKRHTAMTKYILVTFPEIQDFMEHPRFGECIFCESIEGHPVESSTYAVPEDLYEEEMIKKRSISNDSSRTYQ